MIRLFSAVPVPDDIAEGLARRQQGLPRARWSPAEKLHITLSFYGELTEETAGELDSALSAISMPMFDLRLSGVGAFNDGADVHAVWAGVTDSVELSRLAAKCATAGRRLGVKSDDRTYRPHVTLAYLRRTPPDRVAAWVLGHNLLQSPVWTVDHFALYSSWKGPDGSHYDLERVYRLRSPTPTRAET